ncbi:MAG: hypothetical protein GTO63_18245 [Anaerolineae bacterium]|nr:hypothetical protein [Anaerolineae bacterium]NIN96712.1 hypothetical protein [Anaerolineae bacterium]NIQ79723.1 hypothetical protein [Anaerolineae bacterium]
MKRRLVLVEGRHFPGCRQEDVAGQRLTWRTLVAAVLVSLLALSLTACEGGYTTRGERVTMTEVGRGGEVDVRVDSANGSTTKDLEFDCTDCIVDVNVTLQVDQGSFKLEFLGEDDEVTLTLEASPGEQASGSGYMVTDGFGEGEYRVTADEAQGVSYHISYQLR